MTGAELEYMHFLCQENDAGRPKCPYLRTGVDPNTGEIAFICLKDMPKKNTLRKKIDKQVKDGTVEISDYQKNVCNGKRIELSR